MLDAACSSMPYDHLLCEALMEGGLDVEFIGSKYVHTDWKLISTYNRRDHFYKGTDFLYRGKARGFLRRYVKSIEHISNMKNLLKIARQLQPDIIHFQWSQLPPIDRWYLPHLRKIAPLVYTIHNSTPLHGEKPKFYRLQQQGFDSFLDNFDAFIAHTHYTQRTFVNNFPKNEGRVNVVPHGLLNYYLNMKGSLEAANNYDIPSDEQVLLFFGNISHYKGLDILIHAMAKLSQTVLSKVRLLVVGRPSMPIEPIRELARSLGVDQRILWDLRFVREEEIDQILRMATLIVMPYRHIDQSGALMTVMNYGKPIVASRLGGFAEILIDGVHGRLVTPEDPQDLAKAIEQLLTSKTLIKKMEESVQTLASEWPTWTKIASQTMAVYESARDRWNVNGRSEMDSEN